MQNTTSSIRLLSKYILGRILPQETTYGRIILPDVVLAKRGTGGINFTPIEVEVTAIGPAVKDITVGMHLVLDSQQYTNIDEDHIIFPETHYGKSYWSATFKELSRSDLEKLRHSTSTQVMRTAEGRQYYVDSSPENGDVISGCILYAHE